MGRGPVQTLVNPDNPEENSDKLSVVARSAQVVTSQEVVARFRGRPMVLLREPYPHYVPMHREMFDQLAYPILGGVSRSRMGDVFAFIGNTAPDLTGNDRYILFGRGEHSNVWDMRDLEWVGGSEDQAIWRSPHDPAPLTGPIPFIMSLAGGDQGIYDDIMQSMAPLVMEKKPDGVIWWIGDGANGKSTLMDAIYKIFPGQLSSITVKRLVDGRDTPSLNGTLANVVKESSEGRIEDTEIYKSIGTHEDFRVHKFHSQDDVAVRGNLHHIFSGNSVPSFNDKGWSARRRTFIIPFNERFESDPNFEEKTFTPELFGHIITEVTRYALKLRDQGYRYKWSAVTLGAKVNYDTDANNAEEYAKELVASGVVGFDNFNALKLDYENWCADLGYVPLGITNVRRAISSVSYERVEFRGDKLYVLPTIDKKDLQPYSLSKPGFYTTPGFKVEEDEVKVPQLGLQDAPIERSESIIKKGGW